MKEHLLFSQKLTIPIFCEFKSEKKQQLEFKKGSREIKITYDYFQSGLSNYQNKPKTGYKLITLWKHILVRPNYSQFFKNLGRINDAYIFLGHCLN